MLSAYILSIIFFCVVVFALTKIIRVMINKLVYLPSVDRSVEIKGEYTNKYNKKRHMSIVELKRDTHSQGSIKIIVDKPLIVDEEKIKNDYNSIVIYFHGNGGNGTGYATMMSNSEKYDDPINTYTTFLSVKYIDNITNGSQSRILNDAQRAVNWIIKKNPKKRIILYGYSLGGLIALNTKVIRNSVSESNGNIIARILVNSPITIPSVLYDKFMKLIFSCCLAVVDKNNRPLITSQSVVSIIPLMIARNFVDGWNLSFSHIIGENIILFSCKKDNVVPSIHSKMLNDKLKKFNNTILNIIPKSSHNISINSKTLNTNIKKLINLH